MDEAKVQCHHYLSLWEPEGFGPVHQRCILTEGHAKVAPNPIRAHLTKDETGQLIMWGGGIEHGIRI